MDYLGESFGKAVELLAALDKDVVSAVRVSLLVSVNATLLAALAGVPAGFLLGSGTFRGKNAVAAILQTLTAAPTVVVGLFCYSLLTAHGPLGSLRLLYTPHAITFGLFFLILPLVTALAMSATQSIHSGIRETALTLGASQLQAAAAVLRDGRFAYLTAVTMAFGRAIGEVGVAMMLGGNIRGFTRTMTTTLALQTDKGEFALALALGMILLAIAFCINSLMHFLKSRAERV